LAAYNEVFCEQMAVTTPIGNPETVARIKTLHVSKGPVLERLDEIRREFIAYLIDEDSKHLSNDVTGLQYESQTNLLAQLKKAGSIAMAHVIASSMPTTEPTMLAEGVVATVDWFDVEKGYGFVDAEGIEGQVFLHAEKLAEARIASVADGDDILCDIGRNAKGVHVLRVHDVQTDPASVQVIDCAITRLFPDRGYGFVRLSDISKDAFFHYSVVPAADREKLTVGRGLKVNLGPDRTGKGLQVKAVVEFLVQP
jgi:cold shock CspA family protein